MAPARPYSQIWRLAIGIVIAAAVYIGLIAAGALYIYLAHGQFVSAAVLLSVVTGATPGGILLLLYSFVGMALGPIVAVRLVHRRSAATLFGRPFVRLATDFAKVAAAFLLLQALFLPFLPDAAARNVGLGTLLAYLPFAIPGLLIQVGAEEIAFRGYLQQQLAARFRSPLVWMLIPSAIFAAGHYAPVEFGPAAVPIMLSAGVFGLLAADLTARTGNLGAAIALHFANNATAFFVVGIDGTMDGLALWTISLDFSDQNAVLILLAADLGLLLVGWLAARVVLRV